MAETKITCREAARVVAEQNPSLSEWEQGRGRVVPNKNFVSYLRRAEWPTASIQVELPREGHTSGGGSGTVAQPVTVVPETWLRELARLLDMPWVDACRFVVPDAPRGAGRPRTLPEGATPRNLRMTDSEFAAVVDFLKKLRVQNSGNPGTS